MDLAIAFNDAGCLFNQMGMADEAYDVVFGAAQALHLSCGGMTQGELDLFSKQLLLLDPAVQRALDRLQTSAPSNPPTNYQLELILHNLRMKHERSLTTNNDTAFMWTELFLMVPQQAAASQEQTTSGLFPLAMAVAIFNQGLILHCGEVQGTRRRLQRALEFYSLADRWYFDVCGQEALSAHDHRNTVGCAILNNAGYVMYQLGDARASESFFARLSVLLLGLDPPATEEEQVKREELVLNVILFFQTPRTAPAA